MNRIASIDILRGIIMIIMVLDHTRDFVHVDSLNGNPTDLNTTTPWLFFTRWITHLCAPSFVFLAGLSAFLTKKKLGQVEMKRFLIKRGFWLILLDLTVLNFAVWWDINFNVFIFNVIATIGTGFTILGIMQKLSVKTIGCIGIFIILTHNLTPLVPSGNLVWQILMPFFSPTAFPIGVGKTFVMGYPPIPWLGILLIGYGAGMLFLKEEIVRKKELLKIGGISILFFIIIRFSNIYGDSVPWADQKTSLFTFLSFINLTKYPPSLDFCLLFLGMSLLLLSILQGMENKFTRIAAVYGSVPLFYYIVHWFIIHPIMFTMLFLQGFKTSDFVFGFNFGRPKEGSGLMLGAVYLIWIGTVLLMYPLCKWYSKYKANNSNWWLKYI